MLKRPITRLELAIILALLIACGVYATVTNAYTDLIETTAGVVGNPASGNERIYADSGTHTQSCLTSTGSSCAPSGGSVTLSNIYGDSLTAPTTATFPTQAASGSLTGISFANDTAGSESGVLLKAQATSAGDSNLILEVQTPPATPYAFRLRFRPNTYGSQYGGVGGCWYDSGTGRIDAFSVQFLNWFDRIRFWSFASTSAFDGTHDIDASPGGSEPGRAGLWDIVLEDDGTNRNVYTISDGIYANRRLWTSVARTSYLTPNNVGICLIVGTNSVATARAQVKVIDWTQH